MEPKGPVLSIGCQNRDNEGGGGEEEKTTRKNSQHVIPYDRRGLASWFRCLF